jgi:hypothetical protein
MAPERADQGHQPQAAHDIQATRRGGPRHGWLYCAPCEVARASEDQAGECAWLSPKGRLEIRFISFNSLRLAASI